MIIHPCERAVSQRWSGGGCLYRDHRGRRVLCDLLGSGTYLVRSEVPVAVEVDERQCRDEAGSFGESLVVATEMDGDAGVWVHLGPKAAAEDCGSVWTDSIEGAGWVVEARADVQADGRPGLPPPIEGFPIPFFWSAKSDLPMRVVRSRVAPVRVDGFGVADLDALASRGWTAQNMSEVVAWSAIDSAGQRREGAVASHLNTARWLSPVPRKHSGLILVRHFDRFHGRQRARVLVDGRFAGWWYSPEQDRVRRWGTDWFGIDALLAPGVERIEIAIDPPAGSPLWSVSSYELWALVRQANQ